MSLYLTAGTAGTAGTSSLSEPENQGGCVLGQQQGKWSPQTPQSPPWRDLLEALEGDLIGGDLLDAVALVLRLRAKVEDAGRAARLVVAAEELEALAFEEEP